MGEDHRAFVERLLEQAGYGADFGGNVRGG